MAKDHRAVIQKQGNNFVAAFHEEESDVPHLPIQDFQELKNIYPDAIPWILSQMEKEADFRRKEIRRCNFMIFFERCIGQLFGCIIGLAGVLGGGYAAIHGAQWTGGIIATAAIGTLAVAFLGKFKKEKHIESESEK